jgi:RNA polymerase sigma-70 factor (ECF subfamily)
LQEYELVGALVARAIERDRDAFGALYDLYFERIYRYVRLKLGDAVEAEDVTATVFLNAWRSIEQFAPQGENSFLAWLFRLAHNALVDRYRRRRDVTPLQDVEDYHLPTDASFDPERVLDWRLTVAELSRALETLTEEQREVVVLRFVEGLSAREVGQIMGKQEGTVRGMQFRAIEALRRALTPAKVRREHD